VLQRLFAGRPPGSPIAAKQSAIKPYNDHYGHSSGDAVLQHAAGHIAHTEASTGAEQPRWKPGAFECRFAPESSIHPDSGRLPCDRDAALCMRACLRKILGTSPPYPPFPPHPLGCGYAPMTGGADPLGRPA
jgi:hypothetical protein